MANRDVLKEVLDRLQNLKLSSPLRTEQNGDENKENILAGQDNLKGRSEEKESVFSASQYFTPDQKKQFHFQADVTETNGCENHSLDKSVDLITVSPVKKTAHLLNSENLRSNSLSSEEYDPLFSSCRDEAKTFICKGVKSNLSHSGEEVFNCAVNEVTEDSSPNAELRKSADLETSTYADCVNDSFQINENDIIPQNLSSLNTSVGNSNSTYFLENNNDSLKKKSIEETLKQNNVEEINFDFNHKIQFIDSHEEITSVCKKQNSLIKELSTSEDIENEEITDKNIVLDSGKLLLADTSITKKKNISLNQIQEKTELKISNNTVSENPIQSSLEFHENFQTVPELNIITSIECEKKHDKSLKVHEKSLTKNTSFIGAESSQNANNLVSTELGVELNELHNESNNLLEKKQGDDRFNSLKNSCSQRTDTNSDTVNDECCNSQSLLGKTIIVDTCDLTLTDNTGNENSNTSCPTATNCVTKSSHILDETVIVNESSDYCTLSNKVNPEEDTNLIEAVIVYESSEDCVINEEETLKLSQTVNINESGEHCTVNKEAYAEESSKLNETVLVNKIEAKCTKNKEVHPEEIPKLNETVHVNEIEAHDTKNKEIHLESPKLLSDPSSKTKFPIAEESKNFNHFEVSEPENNFEQSLAPNNQTAVLNSRGQDTETHIYSSELSSATELNENISITQHSTSFELRAVESCQNSSPQPKVEVSQISEDFLSTSGHRESKNSSCSIIQSSFANTSVENTSAEDIDKSTAVLVSDSSGKSSDISLSSQGSPVENKSHTSKPPELNNTLNVKSSTSSENSQEVDSTSHTQINVVITEKVEESNLERDNKVINKSSSAFIVLTSPNSEDQIEYSPNSEKTLVQTSIDDPLVSSSSRDLLTDHNSASKRSCCTAINVEEFDNSRPELASKYIETIEISIKANEADIKEDAVDSPLNIPQKLKVDIKQMAEMFEKLQEENSDLKLELNASQQAKASLELEISKKDEIILKTQAEALKKEQQFQQEIKAIKEQLKEKSSVNEKDVVKQLEEALKEAKAKESQAVSELNARINDELNYRKIMEEYEKTIAARIADSQKLKEENETVTRHLSNLESYFSDLHQKYERTKTIIDGFKTNEEKLRKKFAIFEDTIHKQEEKYESLKTHAKAQIEKSNKEIMQHKEKYDIEVNKLNAIIKRLEIKSAALETSLEQKTNECIALAALCDEVTGKKV